MTGMIVVDSSVAFKWFLNEPESDKARALLASDSNLLAPDFLLAEVANGLRRQQRAGAISAEDVIDSIAGLTGIFSELSPTVELVEGALRLSQELDHSVYDCLFLAMSQQRGARLATADLAFVAKLAGTPDASRVVLLADWK